MLHVRPTLRLLRPAYEVPFPLLRQHQRVCTRNLLTLAIETSCDDTAVAILEKDDNASISGSSLSASQIQHDATTKEPARARLLFNEKITAPNTGLGGIHPIEALESHQANLAKLIARAVRFLPDAQSSSSLNRRINDTPRKVITITDTYINNDCDQDKASDTATSNAKTTTKVLPDFISVTRGPGMRSNLHCGLDTAKGLSVAWSIPLLGIHHMQAHALTPRLVDALEARDRSLQTTKATSTIESTLTPSSPTTAAAAAAGSIAVPDNSTSKSTTIVTSEKPDPLTSTITSQKTTKPTPTTNFPFLTLLISGGHTLLLHSTSLTTHSTLATTTDIAIGDCLDKCGRIILPASVVRDAPDTAFARQLSEFAFDKGEESWKGWRVPRSREQEILGEREGDEWGWRVGVPFAETRRLAFSFTGIFSRVGEIVRARSRGGKMGSPTGSGDDFSLDSIGSISDINDDEIPDSEMSIEERRALGRAAIGTAFEHLASRTVIALQSLASFSPPQQISTLVVSGGVAANPFLRYYLRAVLDVRGFSHVRLAFPPPWLCTDNAAMIAWCGMEMYEAGYCSELDVGSLRKWSMDGAAADGGILGVGGWKRVGGAQS